MIPEKPTSTPGYDRDGDSDMNTGNNDAARAAGLKSATMSPKTSQQYIADAQASGMCTCGVTLGK